MHSPGIKKAYFIQHAFDSKDIESIGQLAKVAASTNARLHCIHVNLISGKLHKDEGKAFEEKLKSHFGDLNVTFTVWSAFSVEDGLEIFCRANKMDILAMLTHDKTTWESIFGAKSVTKSMALRNKFPLLAFHS